MYKYKVELSVNGKEGKFPRKPPTYRNYSMHRQGLAFAETGMITFDEVKRNMRIGGVSSVVAKILNTGTNGIATTIDDKLVSAINGIAFGMSPRSALYSALYRLGKKGDLPVTQRAILDLMKKIGCGTDDLD